MSLLAARPRALRTAPLTGTTPGPIRPRQLLVIPALLIGTLLLSACTQENDQRMVGTLERDRVELTVESNEPILEIAVRDGDQVEAGALILRQDPTRHEARLAQARAQAMEAEARLAELQRGPRPEDIAQARSQVSATEALVRNALANRDREREIMARGLGEEQALDLRQATYDDLRARLAGHRQALERLLNGTTVEELQQAEARRDAMQAAVALADLDLQRLEIRAPLAGRLDRLNFQLGERPAPGATVAVLLDGARSFARIYVPEPLRAQMTPGARVSVQVDGVATALQGTVRWVSADASFTPYFALTEHDRSRVAYLAEVDLPDAGALPSGTPLEAELIPGQGSLATIPARQSSNPSTSSP